MQYKPLRTMNPTEEDMTRNSSIWLSSRIMPGIGNDKVSFPSFREINNSGARIGDLWDFEAQTGLVSVTDSGAISNVENATNSLEYRGHWVINNNAVVGRCQGGVGLTCPFNTFNVGQKYKNGWRPQKNGN